MLVVRPVKKDDLDGLITLAEKAGTGLTTLPAHKPTMMAKIEESVAAFISPPDISRKCTYFFVMEDTETGIIAGTSAIIAGVGFDKPFYSYRLLHLTQESTDPPCRVDTELLQLSNDFVGAAEVATLFLDRNYRIANAGKLLSKARYMFMAAHPDRFSDRVIAELRGWVDEDNNSPFWESIGRHFFGMNFNDADRINGQGNSQFIADLMPKFPIYTALLPTTAQDVISKPHDSSRPARRLLEQEGFRFSGAVDIFDGGPTMEVSRQGIWTVRATQKGLLGGIVDGEVKDPQHMAANIDIQDFRVTLTNVVETGTGLWVPANAAKALNVNQGDLVSYAPLQAKPENEKGLL